MKKLIFGLLLLINIHSQAQDLVVANIHKNQIYIGVDNILKVSVGNLKYDSLLLSMTDATISKTKNQSEYVISINTDFYSGLIQVRDSLRKEYEKNPQLDSLRTSYFIALGQTHFIHKYIKVIAYNKGKVLYTDSVKYIWRRIPDEEFRALVLGRDGGEISRELLLQATRLTVSLYDFPVKGKTKVISFEFMIRDSLGIEHVTYVEGNKIPDEIKACIEELHKGQKVYFRNIVFADAVLDIRKIDTLLFKIK